MVGGRGVLTVRPQNNLATWLLKHSPVSVTPTTSPSNSYGSHMQVRGDVKSSDYEIPLFMKAQEFLP